MDRLITLFLIASSVLSISCSKAKQTGERPNILMILVDDMGYNGISCYGEKPWKTPNIDKLAESGIKFTNAYASPVCSPTRASIMTGKNPARLGITNWIPGWAEKYANPVLLEKPFQQYLPDNEFTIAEALKKGGYATAMVGKWHLGENPQVFPDKQGFDYQYMASVSNLSQYFVEEERDQLIGFFNEDGENRTFLEEHLVNKAIKWFSEKPKDKPWFMYFSTHAVHMPIAAKNEIIRKYLDQGLPEKGTDAANYAAMHQHMDDAIGRLMDYLNSNDLNKNTIIIFLSDNGGRQPQTNNSPLRGGKGELLEGGIRVPLLVVWKGKIAAGNENHTPVITDDLYPTILDLVGLATEENQIQDGTSIKKVLLGKNESLPERNLYWHYPHYTSKKFGLPSSAIRSGDWKLINFLEDDSRELYNLKTDIGEENNLITKNPEIAKRLYHDLDNWRKALKVQMPEKNPDYNPALPSGWPEELAK
jgi:arylsulfatase A-like enzyme